MPTLIVAFSIALAAATLYVDRALDAQRSRAPPYLFSGTADAARTLLSALASSVLSIAFSLTMVALQQASSQFSPRVLRGITASRVNQLVVGIYAGTFTYALLVLRTVRSEAAAAPFVPALSVTTAVLLALLCSATLMYFIHHVSLSLQASEVIAQLHRPLLAQLARLYPDALTLADAQPAHPDDERAAGAVTPVRTQLGGFVRRVDGELGELPQPAVTIWLRARPGDYVPRGGVLAELRGAGPELARKLEQAYVLYAERSDAQDPLFDIRQLVDIGLRALSPGVNDPTTAEYVLRRLGDALGVLAGRQFPTRRSQRPGCVTIYAPGLSWDDFVDSAFSQLRRAARADYDVTRCMIELLRALGELVTLAERTCALRAQLRAVREGVARATSWITSVSSCCARPTSRCSSSTSSPLWGPRTQRADLARSQPWCSFV